MLPALPQRETTSSRDPRWPGAANIAVQFVLNYEEGAENSVLDGDPASETFLSEIIGAQGFTDRHMSMESLYEYGSRAGLWRLLRVFERRALPLTVFGVAMALARNPDAVGAFLARGDEIACHGLRWLSYQQIAPEVERRHLAEAVALMTELTGAAPLGWYTGRDSPQTRHLVVEHGGFLYDRDYLGDELPFWIKYGKRDHLVIPFSFETNDNRFDQNHGFSTADEFATYLSDCFDLLYEEGADAPKLMSISLHDRLIGRPAKAVGLIRFLDHARKHDRVWFCTGKDIAEHWRRTHPPHNAEG